LGQKEKRLWCAVADVVARAGEHSTHGEVNAARQEVAHQAAVDEVVEAIEQATQSLNQSALSNFLLQAQTLEINESKYHQIPTGQYYLDRIIEGRRLCQEAIAAVDELLLVYAVEYCDSFDFNQAECQQARVLRDRVMTANTNLRYWLNVWTTRLWMHVWLKSKA
jgi:hypothetical protein